MTDSNRQERVERYRAASLQAHEHARAGKKDETLRLLTENRDVAGQIGDEDYRAFFEAEILIYSVPDYARQIDILRRGLDWASQAGQPPDFFLLRSLGAYYGLAGDPDAAIEWFDKALAVNPNDSEVMRGKGVALSHKGDQDAAIEWFDKALAVNPRDWNAIFEKGASLASKGNHDAAIEWFDKALAVNPQASVAMRQKAVALSNKGDQDTAIEWYDKALALSPRDEHAMRNKGAALASKGDYNAGIEWLDKALAIDPEDGNAMRLRGVALSNKGDHDAAIEWYDKALALNARDADSLRDKGATLSNKGHYDAAIESYDRALAVNPKDGYAMRLRGIALSNKGDYEAAIEWYDKALALNARDGDSMREKGAALSNKRDLVAAIEWYDKALGVNPRDGIAMRNRGVALANKGDHNEAIMWFDRALEVNDKDWVAMHQKAVALWVNRDMEGSVTWLENALRISPDSIMVMRDLAIVLDNTHHRGGAMECYDRSVAEIEKFIVRMRKAFESEAAEYLDLMAKQERESQAFLEPRSRLRPDQSLLMVLRKWNSYTPALPPTEVERSRGGGYFIWHNGHGTIIDPGYNFIENFDEAKCRLRDIDNIVITHAHDDHTANFESLRSLLFKYNDAREAGGERRFRIFLNNGAFQKFGGLLNLKHDDLTERLFTLNPGGEHELCGGGRLRVLPAYHDEVLAVDQAVGVLISLDTSAGERRILFTGDTGLYPLKRNQPKPLADTSDRRAEIWRKYLIALGKDTPHVMVVHIGSIKKEEVDSSVPCDPAKACYANHLGIIGTARVVAMCRPKLAVISEFGEEMKRFRVKLVGRLQRTVLDQLFRDDPRGPMPRAIPGDLAFVYDLAAEKFLDCVSCDWSPANEIDFDEGGNADRDGVYYFAAKNRAKYLAEPARYVQFFRALRLSRRGMYFLDDAD